MCEFESFENFSSLGKRTFSASFDEQTEIPFLFHEMDSYPSYPSQTLSCSLSFPHQTQLETDTVVSDLTDPWNYNTAKFNSKKNKGKSDEVLIAQLFKREPHQPLDLPFLLQVMAQAFPDEAASWAQQIESLNTRSAFLERMCNCKMPNSKLQKTKNILFWMLRCVDHFAQQQTAGFSSTMGPAKSFHDEFRHSICRVLSHPDRQRDTFRRNPNLLHSLALSHQYLTYLLRFIQVDRNLGFYLLFVSCVEGRGVYHGRTSTCMSVPHKCYRYMIETMGGKRYADIPVADRLPYQHIFISEFESKSE